MTRAEIRARAQARVRAKVMRRYLASLRVRATLDGNAELGAAVELLQRELFK